MKKHFRPTLQWIICMTLDCVKPTRSSVIQIIHRKKCFFSILPKFLFLIIYIHAYYIHISQGSVEMHLLCGRIYNNHIIAIVHRVWQWKNFQTRSIIGEDIYKSKVPLFLWPTIYVQWFISTGQCIQTVELAYVYLGPTITQFWELSIDYGNMIVHCYHDVDWSFPKLSSLSSYLVCMVPASICSRKSHRRRGFTLNFPLGQTSLRTWLWAGQCSTRCSAVSSAPLQCGQVAESRRPIRWR